MVESVGIMVRPEERRHVIRAITWFGLAVGTCAFVIACSPEESLQATGEAISEGEMGARVVSGGRVSGPERG